MPAAPGRGRRRIAGLLAAAALVAGACSSDGDAPTPATGAADRSPWGDFGEEQVAIGGLDGLGDVVELCVLVAATGAQRSVGLMDAPGPELGGYDGMLFTWDDDTTGGFWMRDTEVPLSIAWFAEDGSLVSMADMDPCGEGVTDCPSYFPGGPYRAALEVPQGELAELGVGPGTRLERTGAACPA